MIDHKYARTIHTGKELEDYFKVNLEVGDHVRGPGGLHYVILGSTFDNYFFARTSTDRPIVMTAHEMDSIKE